jgi:hypothetical protein
MKPKPERTMPHAGVYTRLQPSLLGGVGVFAVRRIKKGTRVFGDDEAKLVAVKRGQIKNVPSGVRRLYRDFSIIKDKGQTFLCPTNFNLMTISWYLNHSKKPNVGCDADFDFFALRTIQTGEELTVDYDSYNQFPAEDFAFKGR